MWGRIFRSVLLVATGCFDPSIPAIAFVCGASEPRCPSDFECRNDGCCHRIGSAGPSCVLDLGVDGPANDGASDAFATDAAASDGAATD